MERRQPAGPPIADGMNPRLAGAVHDALRQALRRLDNVVSRLHAAYNGELQRRYGYDFCLPVEDSAAKLAESREEWFACLDEFRRIVSAEHYPQLIAELERGFKQADEDARKRNVSPPVAHGTTCSNCGAVNGSNEACCRMCGLAPAKTIGGELGI